ncbi:MAG: hypothetical protein IGBAC_1569 [Ignavibacteriae bacterium]|nr:MAG: hypothetical protein IGBAC_1569 [Ignavibacteriota bacterium]
MKKIIFYLLVNVFAFINLNAQEAHLEISTKFLEKFFSRDYKLAYEMFDSTVKSKIDLEQFSNILNQIENNYGTFKNLLDTTNRSDESNWIYDFGTLFEKGKLNFRIVANNKNEISGFWITPYPEKTEYKIPDYVNIAKFKETEVEFGKEEWKIKGTLTIPTRIQKPPCVILIHGSGPNDRDETIGPNKPFKDIAWGLASNRIAVLRYDKRTKLYGHKMQPKSITVRNEVIEDVLEAIKYLKTRDDIDTNNIFLIGHSLGAMLAPAIAFEAQSIRGLILLAAPARKLESLILNQFQYIFSIDDKIDEEEKRQLEILSKQIDSLNNQTISENTQILGMYPDYFYELAKLNPIEIIKKLKKPVLILQGERDYQVTMEDFETFRKEFKNHDNVKLISYPGLNHLFMYGEGKSTPEETLRPNSIGKMIIEDMNNWIKTVSEK